MTPSFPGTETQVNEPVNRATIAFIEASKQLDLAKKAEKTAKSNLLFVMKREGISSHTIGRKTFTVSGKESLAVRTEKEPS